MTAKKLLTGLFAAVMTAGAFAPAVVYAQQTSYKDAIKAYNSGNREAAMDVAMDYKYGWDGAEVNGTKAVEWLDKAFDAGVVRAATMAGTMYFTGEGVKQDFSKAEKFYRKAAAKDDESAQIRLGRMYYYGNGVKTDYESAARWYAAAARKYEQSDSCSIACLYLGQIYYYGWKKGGKLVTDDKSALKWLEKSYSAGYVEAATLIASINSKGTSEIKQDKAKARKWLIAAAEKGYEPAIKKLALDYFEGKNGKADNVQAYVWAAVLVSRDSSEASVRLRETARSRIPAKEQATADKAASAAVKKYEQINYEPPANNLD